jgi:hypothetical protein
VQLLCRRLSVQSAIVGQAKNYHADVPLQRVRRTGTKIGIVLPCGGVCETVRLIASTSVRSQIVCPTWYPGVSDIKGCTCFQ